MRDVISVYTQRIEPEMLMDGYTYRIEPEGLIKAPFLQTFLPIAFNVIFYIGVTIVTVLLLRRIIRRLDRQR